MNIRLLSAAELEDDLGAFIELLRDAVDSGASLGFHPALTREAARSYWLSLRSELDDDSRLLTAAYANGRLIGGGQLALSTWPAGRHRAEVQKLIVHSSVRGLGIGGRIMASLQDTAAQRGRSLLVLHTRRGAPPESFYKRLGYREAGYIPGFTVGAAGERYDTTTLYRDAAH